VKKSVHPAVIVAVLVVVVSAVVLVLWKGSQGVNPGPGKLQSDLKLDEASKAAQADPDKFKAAVEASMAKDKAAHGQ
jgi:hypothetical protein